MSTIFIEKRLEEGILFNWANYAPDSSYMVFAKNHNLYLMEVGDEDSVEIQLTEDGERWFSYQWRHGDTTADKRMRAGLKIQKNIFQ